MIIRLLPAFGSHPVSLWRLRRTAFRLGGCRSLYFRGVGPGTSRESSPSSGPSGLIPRVRESVVATAAVAAAAVAVRGRWLRRCLRYLPAAVDPRLRGVMIIRLLPAFGSHPVSLWRLRRTAFRLGGCRSLYFRGVGPGTSRESSPSSGPSGLIPRVRESVVATAAVAAAAVAVRGRWLRRCLRYLPAAVDPRLRGVALRGTSTCPGSIPAREGGAQPLDYIAHHPFLRSIPVCAGKLGLSWPRLGRPWVHSCVREVRQACAFRAGRRAGRSPLRAG